MCLEGEWVDALTDRKTVQPLVAYVSSITPCDYVHRRVQDTETLLSLVDRWCVDEDLQTFGILYITAHGAPGSLWLDDDDGEVTLDRLGETIDGRGEGGILYLGSCSVVADEAATKRFAQRAGLSAVVGYTESVDFAAGSAVDLLALYALNKYARAGNASNYISRQMPGLVDEMGFRVIRP